MSNGDSSTFKYAYYPGCVSQTSGKELDISTRLVASKLGIELIDFPNFSCCGAGFVDEVDIDFNTVLNARNLSIAREQNLDMLTICSTCQGMLSRSNQILNKDVSMKKKADNILSKVGKSYDGKETIKHLLWILVADYGLDKLKEKIVKPLTGLRVASFYGCHLLRPQNVVGGIDDPDDPQSFEKLIEILGATPVIYGGRSSCCGFPGLLHKEEPANKMAGLNLLDAKTKGADIMVTSCPLCHISLDSFQETAENYVNSEIDLPVLHLPQLVGLALGISPDKLGIDRHLVDAQRVLNIIYQ